MEYMYKCDSRCGGRSNGFDYYFTEMKCPKCGSYEFVEPGTKIETYMFEDGKLSLDVELYCTNCNISIDGYEFMERKIDELEKA